MDGDDENMPKRDPRVFFFMFFAYKLMVSFLFSFFNDKEGCKEKTRPILDTFCFNIKVSFIYFITLFIL